MKTKSSQARAILMLGAKQQHFTWPWARATSSLMRYDTFFSPEDVTLACPSRGKSPDCCGPSVTQRGGAEGEAALGVWKSQQDPAWSLGCGRQATRAAPELAVAGN